MRELAGRVVLEHRLVVRILEQARMNHLRNRARFGEPHLRAVFDAVLAVRRRGAAPVGNQHGDDALAVGRPVDARHERREQRRLRDLHRLARRDVGDEHVRRVVEVRDVRDLRAGRRPRLRRERRALRRLERLRRSACADRRASSRCRVLVVTVRARFAFVSICSPPR